MTNDFLPNRIVHIMGEYRSKPKGLKNKVIDLVERFRNRQNLERMKKERQMARIGNLMEARLCHCLETAKLQMTSFIYETLKQELK